jgi:hypothetical protein
MKKKRVLTILCAVAVLSAGLVAFTTCDTGTGDYVMNNQADLTGLTIGTSAAVSAPVFISSRDWADWDYDLSSEDYKIIYLPLDSDLVNVYIRPRASENARIAWGIGDQITRPSEFYDYRVPATFKSEDFIYIRVTSEDTSRTQYYRFFAFLLRKGVSLADVYVDGKRAVIGAACPEWDYKDKDGLELGTLDITMESSQPKPNRTAPINAIAFQDTSTFRYARVPEGSDAAPVFGTNATMNFVDLDTLYIEVTAENKVDKAFYKFLVTVGRIATITTLKLDNLEVTGKGVPNADWASARPGYFGNADMPGVGWTVNVDLEDTNATWEYQLMTTTPNTAPASGWGKTPKAVFNNSNWLAIKVTSHSGLSFMYYKINVELLAANFKQHPISEVYYYWMDPDEVKPITTAVTEYNADNTPKTTVQARTPVTIDYASPTEFPSDDGSNNGKNGIVATNKVKALNVILDRSVTGTYQWYESNSWYGGYGFDQDGRVCYDIQDAGGTNQFNWEQGFVSNEYHHREWDEKKNRILFNGGNQQACFVLPGREIEGASGPFSGTTGANYTPPINRRPFIAGFSYESHFYWVVITETGTGRKTTSERATIISERNKSKKHLLIDVNNSYKLTSGGNPLRFKNYEVFTEKYDKWRIPFNTLPEIANFPGGFSMTDYKVLTAQARFYLADGSNWIMNWTNGNLSFEDNSNIPEWYPIPQHGPTPTEADIENYGVDVLEKEAGCGAGFKGVIQGLFYNLTNQNATYDITSDVKEPSTGGLPDSPVPTHIVIEPSGDHTKGPTKDGFPPLDANGKPDSSILGKDLQGWFCGYVELVELHFEGPR